MFSLYIYNLYNQLLVKSTNQNYSVILQYSKCVYLGSPYTHYYIIIVMMTKVINNYFNFYYTTGFIVDYYFINDY